MWSSEICSVLQPVQAGDLQLCSCHFRTERDHTSTLTPTTLCLLELPREPTEVLFEVILKVRSPAPFPAGPHPSAIGRSGGVLPQGRTNP